MEYITTALSNEIMLIACVVLIVILALCICDLIISFREMDRLDAEEEQEKE